MLCHLSVANSICSYICTLMFSTSGHFHSQTLLYAMNNDGWLHVATWHQASGTSAVPFLNGPGDDAIVLQAHKNDEAWYVCTFFVGCIP